MLADRVICQPREVLVLPIPSGEPDQREARRQQPPIGEVIDGRKKFLSRQVAGNAEHDENARLGDPGNPAIARIAQRVGHQPTISAAAALSPRRCAWIVASSCDHESANRKSTRLNSSHVEISYAVFCLKKKKK